MIMTASENINISGNRIGMAYRMWHQRSVAMASASATMQHKRRHQRHLAAIESDGSNDSGHVAQIMWQHRSMAAAAKNKRI